MRVPSYTHIVPTRRDVALVWFTTVYCIAFGAVDRADAAGAEKDVRTLEEVIVTAQKREERLQDVPISISVMSGDELDKSSISSINDALSRVPGVAVTDIFLGGGGQLTVRGVTASLALFQGASPIAYYLDSVPFGFVKSAIVPDPNPYDLQRVEVLRGPQGTLYGASALNGVVRVLTHDANPDKVEFKARTAASSTQDGSENYRADATLNVPLVAGKLAARASVGYENLSGWIDRPNAEDANDAEIRNARLKINAQPTDQLSIGLSAWTLRSDYGAPSIGLPDLTNPSLLDEPIAMDYDAYGLKIGYEAKGFSIVSNTSYLEFRNKSKLDVAAGSGLDLRLQTDLPARTFAEEVILNSTGEGDWRWTLGGIYRDSKDRLWQYLPPFYLAPTSIDNLSESYAVFGELTRVLAGGRWELTAGLRYFEDDVGQRELSRLTGVPADQLLDTDRTFDATTPRVVLTWHPSDATTFYASYSQGFRSGSDQIPTVLAVADIPPAKPDKLTNYELGTKAALAGGTVMLEAAVYYIDWQDIQLPIEVAVAPGVNLQTIINGESASGIGVDLGIVGRPAAGLQLGLNVSWNDLTTDGDVISNGFLLFAEGDRLSFSPEYTVGASADYSFPLGSSGYDARISASANYTSERSTTQLGVGRFDGDDVLMGNVSFGVDSENHWSAMLFVDNVNNEQASPYKQGVPHWNARLRPRTVGLQLEYRF